jgi:hypothetical protein
LDRNVKLDPPTEAPAETSRPKRDPTAELFDIIQTSKQKREVRQQHQAQAEANRSPAPAQESGLIKVILIGAGLALIGFSLGQLFQQSAPPTEPKVTRESPAPPVASANSSASPTPAESLQVLDRSNEKMTIKAVVTGTPKPASKVASKTAQTTQAPPREEPPENERELQELKDLKKELQELKAMKDQLRDNSSVEEYDEEARGAYPSEGSPTFPEPETITPGGPGGDGSGRKYRSPPSGSPPPDSYY